MKDAGLKGRGGAGFPTGVKWGLMPKDESINIRYLLCNADEMEPNTWKDRMLMEQLPHLLAHVFAAFTGQRFVPLHVNMVSLLRNMEQFFARESCGFCTPCRDGLPWSVKLLMARVLQALRV